MRNVIRLALAAATAAALVVVGTGTAFAAQGVFPPPPPRICEFSLISVTAHDLQNDGVGDAVFLRLGTTATTNTVDFTVPWQTEPAAAFGSPTAFYVAPARLPVRLFLKAATLSQQVGATASVPCLATNSSTRTFTNNDATYVVTFSVTVEVIDV